MKKVTIYHNPRCSKSREGLEYLERNGIVPTVVKYLENPPSEEELEQVLKQLGMDPEEIVRKKEREYRENFKEGNYSREEWIKILHENPKLIERPIIITPKGAVIARPVEKIDEIL